MNYQEKKIPETMEEIFEISNKNKKKNKEKKKMMTNLVKEEKNDIYSSHLLNPAI